MTEEILYPLENFGYDSRYFISTSGKVINQITNKEIKPYRYKFKLKTIDGYYKQVTQKELYKKSFGVEYTTDNVNDLDGEQWKEIDGSKGRYFVSNLGRVKSKYYYDTIIMAQCDNGRGYLKLELVLNDQTSSFYVHRLVALAFVQNDDEINNNTVDHIDGDKSNNKATNLRWVSLQDNIRLYHAQQKDNSNEKVLHNV